MNGRDSPCVFATNHQITLNIPVNLVHNDEMLCNTDTNMFTVYNFDIGDLQWEKKFDLLRLGYSIFPA